MDRGRLGVISQQVVHGASPIDAEFFDLAFCLDNMPGLPVAQCLAVWCGLDLRIAGFTER